MAKQFNCLRTVSMLLSAAMLATSVPVYSVSAAETQQDEAGIEGTGADVTTGSAITVQPAEDDSGGDLDTQPEEGNTEEEGENGDNGAAFSTRAGAPQENEEIDFSTQYTDVVRFTTADWGGTVGATIKPAYGIIDLSDREEVILEEGVFANNPNITEVRLPNYTWYVGENSFDNCTNLKKFKTGWINCYMCKAEGRRLEADGIFGNLDLDELTVSYIQATPWKNGSWWTPFGNNIHAKRVIMCPYGGYNIMHEDDDGLPQGMTYFEFGEGSTNWPYEGKPLSSSENTCKVIQLNAKLRYGQNGLTIKNITDWTALQHLVCKGGIDSSVKRDMVQSNVKLWVYKGSEAETWCINNTRDYGYIDSNGYKHDVLGENVSGGDTEIEEDREASIPDQTIVVNFDNDDAAEIKVDDFGSGEYKIADIEYTFISSATSEDHRMSDGLGHITINKERGSIVLSKEFLKKWIYSINKDKCSYGRFKPISSNGSISGMPRISYNDGDKKYGYSIVKFEVKYNYDLKPTVNVKQVNIDYANLKDVTFTVDKGHGYKKLHNNADMYAFINNARVKLDTISEDDGTYHVLLKATDIKKEEGRIGFGKTTCFLGTLYDEYAEVVMLFYDSRVGGEGPSVNDNRISIDSSSSSSSIEIGEINLGTLGKRATNICAVRIDDGYNVPATLRSDNKLYINKAVLVGLKDGEHKIHVVFNDMNNTVVKDKILIATTGFYTRELFSGQIIDSADMANKTEASTTKDSLYYIYSNNSKLDLSNSSSIVIGMNSFVYDGIQEIVLPESTSFSVAGYVNGDTVESVILGFDTAVGRQPYCYGKPLYNELLGNIGYGKMYSYTPYRMDVVPDNITVTHVGQPYIDIFNADKNKWCMLRWLTQSKRDKFNITCNKDEEKYLVGVTGESINDYDTNYGANVNYIDNNKAARDVIRYTANAKSISYNKSAQIKDWCTLETRFGNGILLEEVSVDGKEANRFHDYTIHGSESKYYSSEDGRIRSVGNGRPNIQFSQDYLRTLSVGEHDVAVTYSDGSSDTGIKLIIQDEETNEKLPDTVEKEPEQPKDDDTDTSSNPDSDPTVLPVITFQFFKDRPKDVVIPFKATEDVASINIEDTPITSYTWDSTNKQLILKQDYLQTLNSGQYRALPKFTSGKIVNNIILEVYDAYADSLLPQLSLTNVDYIQGNIPLTVYMGTGETEATSVDSLVYKGIAIDAKGNMRMFNSNEARIASIDTSRAADEGDLFYIDEAGKLIVTEDAVRLLGLVPGSTYALGCTFNNSVKTASLNRAFITVYNKSEDIPAEDKDAPAVDKDKIDESNGGNTGDSGNAGDGGNTGSGDGGSGSDGGNTGSGDGCNTGGSGDTGNTGSGDSGNTGDSGSGSGSGNTGDGGNTGSGDSGNTGNTGGSGDSGSGSGSTGVNGGSGDSGSGSGSTGGTGGTGSDSGTGGTGSGSGSGTGSGTGGSTGGTGSTGTGSGSTGGTGSTGTGSGIGSGSNGAGSGNGNGSTGSGDSTGSGSTGSETGNGGTGSGSGSTGNGAGSVDEGSGSGTGTGSGSTGTGSTGTGTGTNQAAKKIPNAVFVKKLAVGSSYQIRLINRHKAKSYVYKSSNKKVAVVNSKGLVKVKSEGKAVIKITAKNKKNQKYVYTVIIKAGKGTPVKDTKKNLKNLKCKSTLPIARFIKTVSKGSVYKLVIKSDTKVKYRTGNKRVATVNSKGKIKALKKGQTHITAVIKQNGIVYKYKILLKVK